MKLTSKSILAASALLVSAPAFAFNHVDCRVQVPDSLSADYHYRLTNNGWRPITESAVNQTGQLVGLVLSTVTNTTRGTNGGHIQQNMVVIKDLNQETVVTSKPETYRFGSYHGTRNARRDTNAWHDAFNGLENCHIKAVSNRNEANGR